MADHFTIQQIRKYYEIIQRQKLRDVQLQSIAMFYGAGAAFGSIKKGDFKAFLDELGMKKKDINEAISEMKKMGLPVEEG